MRIDDADNPLFKTLLACGQAVNIPITTVTLGDTQLQFPVLLPKDVLQHIAQEGGIHKAIGVPLKRASETLVRFWAKFKFAFPQHDIFQLNLSDSDFGSIVPYYLHGDGGRTFKHESIVICSMYPALGMGTSKCRVADMQPSQGQSRKRRRGEEPASTEVDMGMNLLGNSFGNRFLFVAIHNNYIKADRSIFYDILKLWGQKMAELFDDGIQLQGRVFKLAVIGLTGDAPFLRDAGLMNRSFSNIRKAPDSTAVLPGVCHLCAAGKTNGPPFEDLDILSACWVPTSGTNNLLPWNEPSPILAYLLAEQRNLANFFKYDLFHVFYAGLGKDFAASSLVFMLRTLLKKRSKVESMKFLNEELLRWRRETKSESLHCGRISWDLLDYEGPRSYPKGKWSKGMDTGKVIKFTEWLLSEHDHGDHGEMLGEIQSACASVGEFVRILFAGAFFLNNQEAHKAVTSGYSFLMSYSNLARMALGLRLALFKLKPKAHSMAHLVLEMMLQHARNPDCVVNPVAFSTFMCEDFVGHVARLSRRVSAKVQGQKVIYRYLTALHLALSQQT